MLAGNNYGAAHEVMLEIIALQEEHGIPLPDGFRFRYAQVAFGAGRTETAGSRPSGSDKGELSVDLWGFSPAAGGA